MKDQKNNLRDLIINNPRAQQRIEIKEIEEQVKVADKKPVFEDRPAYKF